MSVGGINPVYEFTPRWQTTARQARGERKDNADTAKPNQLDLFDSMAMARDSRPSASAKKPARLASDVKIERLPDDQKIELKADKETKRPQPDEHQRYNTPAERHQRERPPPESPPARIDALG